MGTYAAADEGAGAGANPALVMAGAAALAAPKPNEAVEPPDAGTA